MAKVWKAETIGPYTAEEFKAIENAAYGADHWRNQSEEERKVTRAAMDEAWRKVEEHSLAAARRGLAGGSFVGMIVRTPMADGYAMYVVMNDKKGVDLGHVDFMDAWRAGNIWERGFRKSDLRVEARRIVGWADLMAERAAEKAGGA